MEPINWRAMTPYQRNALIAEKVMGRRIVKDEWVYWLVERTDGTGTEEIPRYSQSLDAAWLLWTKLAEGDDGKAFVRQCKFMCAWTEDDDVEHYDWRTYNAYRPFLEIGDMPNVTAERICIAMLRAFGYEVLTEETSQ